LTLPVKVRKSIPVDSVSLNKLFDNVLVVKDELLLILVEHFVILEVVPAEILYRVVLEFEFTGRLVLLLHVF
jgi:hypothetical protein